MRTKNLIALALVLALAAPVTVLAADAGRRDSQRGERDDEAGPWIHVEVREAGGAEESVNINLPLALAQAALAASDGIVKEHMHFGDEGNSDFTVADLRRMWKEAKKAGNAEFVTVESTGETVRIFRKDDFVFINVDESEDSGDEDAEDGGGRSGPSKVRVRMPVALVDALLSGEGEELDMTAAFEELEKVGHGEIVRVEDGADVVRIWIDDEAGTTR